MEWKPIETVPFKRQVVVGRHDWEAVTTVYWVNQDAARKDMQNWSGPPTHWLDGITLPPSPQQQEMK